MKLALAMASASACEEQVRRCVYGSEIPKCSTGPLTLTRPYDRALPIDSLR
jgi:hypothetical protein